MALNDKGYIGTKYEKIPGYRIDLPLSDREYLPMEMYSYWRSKELLEKLYIEWPRIWVEVRAWADKRSSSNFYDFNHASGMVTMELSRFPETDVIVCLNFGFSGEGIFNICLDFKTWKILDISLRD